MEHILKTSALVILFYGCYKLFLQRETFFEHNRWFLLFGLVISFVLPFLIIPVYIETAPLDLSSYTFETTTSASTTIKSFNYLYYITLIYIIGVVFFTLKFLIQLGSLLRVILKTKSVKTDGFLCIETNQNISPFSFFKWIVYNPKHFTESELRQIITHEKVHASQKHSLDILLTRISCILLWFNPFMWLYNKDLKQNLEFIADSLTANQTDCKKSYQYTLLKTSMPSHQMALSNPFYNSLIKKRIVMLHKSQSKKINLIKYAFILPLLGLFLMSFNTKEIYITKNQSFENFKEKELIEVIITKDFTNSELEALQKSLEKEGYNSKISGIKRNSKNEIIAIKIEVSSKNTNANFNLDGDEAISPIKISIEDGKISISNSSTSKEKHMVFVTKEGHQIINSDDDSNVFIFKSDDDNSPTIKKEIIIKNGDTIKVTKNVKVKQIHVDTEDVETSDNPKKVHKIIKIRSNDEDNNMTWSTEEDEKIIVSSKTDAKVKIVASNGKEPLYILDGKEVDNISNIDPNSIDKIDVLKGESATKVYGDKGKEGVILITSKNKNSSKYTVKLSGEALYRINGKDAKKEDVDKLNPEDIASINVLKDEAATKKYGEKAKNGVIEITTKKK